MDKITCTKEIGEYLISKDSIMKEVINDNFVLSRDINDDLFSELVRTIIAQQISTRVAEVLCARVLELCKEIKVENIKQVSDEDLRSCGLSFRKISYLRSLIDCVETGKVDLENIDQLDDDEIVEELVQIKGIGPWSAKMFLIFSLKRDNVFTLLDGGLKRAVQHFYFNDQEIDEVEVDKLVDSWSPYGSYASLYLWESLKRI